MIDTYTTIECTSAMNIISWDEIPRAIVIGITAVTSVGYGYWLAIRGNDEDVKDLKEAAQTLQKNK